MISYTNPVLEYAYPNPPMLDYGLKSFRSPSPIPSYNDDIYLLRWYETPPHQGVLTFTKLNAPLDVFDLQYHFYR